MKKVLLMVMGIFVAWSSVVEVQASFCKLRHEITNRSKNAIVVVTDYHGRLVCKSDPVMLKPGKKHVFKTGCCQLKRITVADQHLLATQGENFKASSMKISRISQDVKDAAKIGLFLLIAAGDIVSGSGSSNADVLLADIDTSTTENIGDGIAL